MVVNSRIAGVWSGEWKRAGSAGLQRPCHAVLDPVAPPQRLPSLSAMSTSASGFAATLHTSAMGVCRQYDKIKAELVKASGEAAAGLLFVYCGSGLVGLVQGAPGAHSHNHHCSRQGRGNGEQG